MVKNVTNSLKLSPTYFVLNISHQYRCYRNHAFRSPWITQITVDDFFILMTISLFQPLSACQTSGLNKMGTKFTGRLLQFRDIRFW